MNRPQSRPDASRSETCARALGPREREPTEWDNSPKDGTHFATKGNKRVSDPFSLEIRKLWEIPVLELCLGFAFVGSQYRIEVGGENFFIDLPICPKACHLSRATSVTHDRAGSYTCAPGHRCKELQNKQLRNWLVTTGYPSGSGEPPGPSSCAIARLRMDRQQIIDALRQKLDDDPSGNGQDINSSSPAGTAPFRRPRRGSTR
ncbi:MAG: DUF1016 family protein [Candidatus Eisenbacteria sp.]|nr:DUF1016 family protein [Candidatus Eisenbacteria bacterium]